jgi:hypothetical protein
MTSSQSPTNSVQRTSVETDRAVLRRIQAQARYVFSEAEFSSLTGREPGSGASQVALHRLSKTGQIALAHRRPTKWLIVPPEQEHYGAPPVDWWLDDLMQDLDPDYYLALLSAARFWGSAHYAYQATQVMMSRPHRTISVGKLRVEFFSKKNPAATPVIRQRTSIAHLRVSTREATLLDLIRHQGTVGGLEPVARIVHDLAPKLTGPSMQAALGALDQVPAAQRLGFLLEKLGHSRQANAIAAWLRARRSSPQPLETSREAEHGAELVAAGWNVVYAPGQEQVLKEIRG